MATNALILLLALQQSVYGSGFQPNLPKLETNDLHLISSPDGVDGLNLSGNIPPAKSVARDEFHEELNELNIPVTPSSARSRASSYQARFTPLETFFKSRNLYSADDEELQEEQEEVESVQSYFSDDEIDEEDDDDDGNYNALGLAFKHKATIKSVTVEDVESDEEANVQVAASAKFSTPKIEKVEPKVGGVKSTAILSDSEFLEFNSKYNTIKSVTELGIPDRITIASTLFNQMSKSQDFKSEIKFAQISPALFLFKISLILRREKHGVMLTAVELSNEGRLIEIIKKCTPSIDALLEIMEYLLRAGYAKACKFLKAMVLVPYLYDLKRDSKDLNYGDFLFKLSTKGYALLMRSLLKEESIGTLLRNNLTLSQVSFVFENILMNGGITEIELIENLRVLLLDLDKEEFKKRQGWYLAHACEGKRSKTMSRTLCPDNA